LDSYERWKESFQEALHMFDEAEVRVIFSWQIGRPRLY
jgi:hypothetical protein